MVSSPDSVVRIEGLEKVYRRGEGVEPIYALRDVNLTIPKGQYVAIMGPSGSGKSTLMNMLGCLDRPTAGKYFLAGQDVAFIHDDELSRIRGRYIGFVFQAFNLIPQLTISQNVQVPLFYQNVPASQRHDMALHALEQVGLGDRINHRPGQLSGGQMQRAAIARALVNQPSMLLADEPTGNLDSAIGRTILDLFDRLHQEQGLTIAIVTHDPVVAQRCQRIVSLKDGRIDRDTLPTATHTSATA